MKMISLGEFYTEYMRKYPDKGIPELTWFLEEYSRFKRACLEDSHIEVFCDEIGNVRKGN